MQYILRMSLDREEIYRGRRFVVCVCAADGLSIGVHVVTINVCLSVCLFVYVCAG